MHGSDFHALPAEPASYVHKTSCVTGDDNIRPAFPDAIDLVLKNGSRDVRVLDREEPAKTATHLRLLQFYEFNSLYGFQDTFGLGPDIELAEEVTGLMKRDLAVEVRADILDSENVDQELGELECARGERSRSLEHLRVVLEEVGKEDSDHARA